MTAKQFFKSTAFKCIAVLMSVLLVSGVLLAVCWGFLEVTDEERFNRKIGQIYGGASVTAVAKDISDKNTKLNNATIEGLWFITEKNDYLVQASSRGNGGNVTCWVTVNMHDETTVKGVGKVLLYSVADPAEFKDNISGDIYNKFSTDYTDGKNFSYGTEGSDDYIKTGASRTLTAVCNDVNAAVAFVKAFAGGGEINDPLAGLERTGFIDGTTTWTVSGTEITYSIVTLPNGHANAFKITVKVDQTKTITDYVIPPDGNGSTGKYGDKMSALIGEQLKGKTLADIEGYLDLNDGTPDDVINTGATKSNQLCYEAAAFALANYDKLVGAAEGGN